jgi:phage FluMu protein Com
MKNCPNCGTLMEAVEVSGLPQQPYDESKIPGVERVRSKCPSCRHIEEGYSKGSALRGSPLAVKLPASA